jgi:hypothetical protein
MAVSCEDDMMYDCDLGHAVAGDSEKKSSLLLHHPASTRVTGPAKLQLQW